ncbi:MAG TPA: hypothetical protein VHO29_17445 [Marmoricola sp.]|nr:hypothetical protein [Marmoricola sp.]
MEHSEVSADSEHSGSRRVPLPLLALGLAALTAVTSWLFGNLPWVVSGFSWPTTEAAPIGSSSEGLAGVRLTIPLVAAFLPSLIAFTAIGAVAATLLPLLLTTRSSGHRRPAIGLVLLTLAVTTTVVTLVARGTIEHHAADAFAGDPRVLTGLVAVVGATTLVGAAFGTLASLEAGFLPLAAALAAGQLPAWVHGFLVGASSPGAHVHTADTVAHALMALLMLAAFVLSVRRSAWWVLLWPVAVAMIWVATPFGVMTVYLAGQLRPSAGLPGSLPDILSGGVDVFRASFWESPQPRWPWLVAVVLAAAWTVFERRTRRSGPGSFG